MDFRLDNIKANENLCISKNNFKHQKNKKGHGESEGQEKLEGNGPRKNKPQI